MCFFWFVHSNLHPFFGQAFQFCVLMTNIHRKGLKTNKQKIATVLFWYQFLSASSSVPKKNNSNQKQSNLFTSVSVTFKFPWICVRVCVYRQTFWVHGIHGESQANNNNQKKVSTANLEHRFVSVYLSQMQIISFGLLLIIIFLWVSNDFTFSFLFLFSGFSVVYLLSFQAFHLTILSHMLFLSYHSRNRAK